MCAHLLDDRLNDAVYKQEPHPNHSDKDNHKGYQTLPQDQFHTTPLNSEQVEYNLYSLDALKACMIRLNCTHASNVFTVLQDHPVRYEIKRKKTKELVI